MGYKIEFNTVLSVPSTEIDVSTLDVGKSYEITKDGERLFPLNIPIDLSDSEYKFVAKVAVRKLTLSKGKTALQIDVLKIYSEEESRIISQNFAKHA